MSTQSGQTQTSDAHLCADSREYWAIDLKIGDRLNIDVNPAPPSVFPEPYQFDVYGPELDRAPRAVLRLAPLQLLTSWAVERGS